MLSSAPLAQPGKEAPLVSRPSGERSFKDSMEAEEEASLARLVGLVCLRHSIQYDSMCRLSRRMWKLRSF